MVNLSSVKSRAEFLFCLLLCWLVFFSWSLANANTFRFHLREDAGTLDYNYGEVNQPVINQLMEGLFGTDRFGKVVPAVAKSWKWRKKHRVLEVILAKTKTWSDGKPVCAADFVTSWNRLREPEFASPYAHFGNFLQKYEAVKCHQLVIHFKQESPEAPAKLAHHVFYPLRKEQLQNSSKAFIQGKGLLTNGYYSLHEWKKNERMVLKRSKERARRDPRSAETIEFLFVPSDITALALYKQGKLDLVKDPAQLQRRPFQKTGDLRVFPTLIAYFFGINSDAKGGGIFKDSLVRRSLSQVLDRVQLMKILGQEVRPVENWVLPEMLPDLPRVRRVPAQTLLNVREQIKKNRSTSDERPVLRVYNKTAHRLLAEWAQHEWYSKLGLQVEIEVVDEKQYWAEIGKKTPAIFLSGVTAPYVHARAFLAEFRSDSTANWTNWQSKKYDALVRAGKIARAERVLLDAGHVIPLYRRGTAVLLKSKWQGFWINPMGFIDLSRVFLTGKAAI